MTPAAFEIIAKLTEARRAALTIFGDGYAARIAPFRKFIQDGCKQNKLPVAKVCIGLIKLVAEHGTEGDKLAAMAACYEEMNAPGG